MRRTCLLAHWRLLPRSLVRRTCLLAHGKLLPRSLERRTGLLAHGRLPGQVCEAAASETQCQSYGPVLELRPVVGVHDVHRGIFRIDSHIPEIELEHHIDGGEIAVRPLVLVLLLLIVQPVLVHN